MCRNLCNLYIKAGSSNFSTSIQKHRCALIFMFPGITHFPKEPSSALGRSCEPSTGSQACATVASQAEACRQLEYAGKGFSSGTLWMPWKPQPKAPERRGVAPLPPGCALLECPTGQSEPRIAPASLELEYYPTVDAARAPEMKKILAARKGGIPRK